MRRREFITLLSGAAAAWPLAVHAQQAAIPVIGFLSSVSADVYSDRVRAFRQGLAEIGYVEGQNVAIEFRWADGRYERLPVLATDLVRNKVAVILASTGIAARAVKAATAKIPIVFTGAADPVQLGLASRLDRPDGNLTGFTTSSGALEAKRVGLLHELVPEVEQIGVLVNPNNPIAQSNLTEMQAAVGARVRLIVFRAGNDQDLDAVFAAIPERHVGALLVATDPFFGNHLDRIVELTARHSIPTMCVQREFTTSGCLMSYGADQIEGYRQAGIYAGRILKGTKIAELPIQRPTKFELIINLKTARAFGLTVPPTLLAIADEVIE